MSCLTAGSNQRSSLSRTLHPHPWSVHWPAGVNRGSAVLGRPLTEQLLNMKAVWMTWYRFHSAVFLIQLNFIRIVASSCFILSVATIIQRREEDSRPGAKLHWRTGPCAQQGLLWLPSVQEGGAVRLQDDQLIIDYLSPQRRYICII